MEAGLSFAWLLLILAERKGKYVLVPGGQVVVKNNL